MRQIFVDLDGVLGDFDGYYEKLFGVCPNQDTYEPPDMWDNIRTHGTFYRDQPLMPDALMLWEGIKKHHPSPIILSGVPWSIPDVAAHKRTWVNRNLGFFVPLICCPSREKFSYGKMGDILIDDRLKYSHLWTKMGGEFVHYTSVSTTLQALSRLFPGVQGSSV
jgi:hypothetical protein